MSERKRQQQCDRLSMADRIDVEKKRVKKERVETSAKKSTSNMNSRACANKWEEVNRVMGI